MDAWSGPSDDRAPRTGRLVVGRTPHTDGQQQRQRPAPLGGNPCHTAERHSHVGTHTLGQRHVGSTHAQHIVAKQQQRQDHSSDTQQQQLGGTHTQQLGTEHGTDAQLVDTEEREQERCSHTQQQQLGGPHTQRRNSKSGTDAQQLVAEERQQDLDADTQQQLGSPYTQHLNTGQR